MKKENGKNKISEEKKEAIKKLFGDVSVETVFMQINRSEQSAIKTLLKSNPEIKELWVKIFPSTDRKETLEYLNKIIGVKVIELPSKNDHIEDNEIYLKEGMHIRYCKICGKMSVAFLATKTALCAEGHTLNVIP